MKKTRFLSDTTVVGNPVGHYIRFSVYLFLFWLLISGSLHLKFICIGAAASFAVAWVCMPLFMIRNFKRTKKYFALDVSLIQFAIFFIWLLKELILSNLDVAWAVWKKAMPVEPKLIRFRMHFDNPLAIALLANSITLTPGTLTLNVSNEGIFEIHALTPTAAKGIAEGNMVRKVAKLFREDASFTIL